MELLTNRYRNLSVLILVIVVQLLLLGYQVRNDEDMRLVRVWAVSRISSVLPQASSYSSPSMGLKMEISELLVPHCNKA